jgi:hypothetical protein
VHDPAGRVRCEKCEKACKQLPTTLLLIAPNSRHVSTE